MTTLMARRIAIGVGLTVAGAVVGLGTTALAQSGSPSEPVAAPTVAASTSTPDSTVSASDVATASPAGDSATPLAVPTDSATTNSTASVAPAPVEVVSSTDSQVAADPVAPADTQPADTQPADTQPVDIPTTDSPAPEQMPNVPIKQLPGVNLGGFGNVPFSPGPNSDWAMYCGVDLASATNVFDGTGYYLYDMPYVNGVQVLVSDSTKQVLLWGSSIATC